MSHLCKMIDVLRQRAKYAAVICVAFGCISFSTSALETSFSLHQGDEAKTQGLSFSVADKFTKSADFYWNIGYSYLDDVKVEWNQQALYFKVDMLDAIVSYRYKPKSYNQFMKHVTLEYQVGASIALTENKFVWPELNEEKYFSKQNDINPLFGFNMHYALNRNSTVNIGFKYQPSFSDFDDITSVYIGFTYKFGNQFGY